LSDTSQKKLYVPTSLKLLHAGPLSITEHTKHAILLGIQDICCSPSVDK